MSRKLGFVKCFCLLAFLVLGVECNDSNLDTGNACVAQYLKRKGKLEGEYPKLPEVNSLVCRLVMPVIMQGFEAALCTKLAEHESIHADCVIKELREAEALDYMLKQEILVMSKTLNEEDSKRALEEVKETLRKIFEEAAKTCDSDPNYGGAFDDVLALKNESLAVLQQNYCLTKFAVESKLIAVENIDFNPKKIVTSDIDCSSLIKKNRNEREKKLLSSLKSRNLSDDQIQCIMDKFQIHRAFDSNVALEVIDQIDVPLDVRRSNRENIAKQLETFIKSVFVCTGLISQPNQVDKPTISLMQF